MPKLDIKIEMKKPCDFHGNGMDAPLWGLTIIIPAPELGEGKTKEAFICEMCLKNQLGKIQDREYMVKEDALH